jgi:D-alanyl-lipoteichoic acid acyltransferase DltB (MBOAT superfamily)
MLFNSYVFLFAFLPVTLGGFCFLSRALGPKAAKLWLTIASLVFYGWWNPIYVVLIMVSMLGNFWLGWSMGAALRQGRSPARTLFFGVGANLLLLGYYKYSNFFVANTNEWLGTTWTMAKVVLPLGISFFTFTQIAYLIDVSRGVVCEYDLGDFLLFITFFPHLIAGPIVHHREMMPQFAELKTYRFHWDNLAVGLLVLAVGLFKKVIIADALSEHATKVFTAAARPGVYAADAWMGVFCYTFQIYFDFSGYSDMAIGLARIFGIKLPLNFNSPYRAVNIIEFWRRWHMSLSRFLREYLYIPLGGNRHGAARRYLNLILTMAIGGLWHGAAWTFVLWGLFHGGCLAVNHLWHSLLEMGRLKRPLPARLADWPGRCLTLVLVMIGWVLFRSKDAATAGNMLGGMFGWAIAPGAGTPVLLKPKLWIWILMLLAGVWFLPNTAEMSERIQPYAEVHGQIPIIGFLRRRWQMTPAWAWFTALLMAASILSLSKAGEFLYYNF